MTAGGSNASNLIEEWAICSQYGRTNVNGFNSKDMRRTHT